MANLGSNQSIVVDVDGQRLEFRVLNVGPDLAAAWLEKNDNNRNEAKGNAAKISRSMELGDFKFLGDPVRFDTEGQLLDGQHRLKGIVDNGIEIPLLVIRGFHAAAQLYMDQGKTRQAGDQVKLAGVTAQSGNNWASIARLVIRWDAGDVLGNLLVPGTAEIVAFCEEHKDQMARAVAAANSQYRRVGARKPVAGATFYFAELIDAQLAHRFFRQLATGEDIRTGDPVFALRDTLLKRKGTGGNKLSSNEELSLFVRAWNATRDGITLQRLQLPREGLKAYNFDLK